MTRGVIKWLARDENGMLYGYEQKPHKVENFGYWNANNDPGILMRTTDRPDVTWFDKEPTPYELKPKAPMTLDEAIAYFNAIPTGCSKNNEEHAQIAAWLEELKAYKERPLENQWKDCDEELPPDGAVVIMLDIAGTVSVGKHGRAWWQVDGFKKEKGIYTSYIAVGPPVAWMPMPEFKKEEKK